MAAPRAGPGAAADPTREATPEPPRRRRVQAVLFMCNFNAVRSMAAEAIARAYFGRTIYVQSAGVRRGEPADPFMVAALDEVGIDAARHRPRTVEELEEWEGLNFDLIVTLSPEAHHRALDLTHTLAAEVEYWPTPDPTLTQDAPRERRLDGYRDVRDALTARIKLRLRA